ncbi:MAG: type II secretion system secretin GspD [Candidatus Bruticola sp.]
MNKFRVYIVTALLTALVSITPAFSDTPTKDKETEPQKPMLSKTIAESMRHGHILLNFENIDIRVLSRMMSELTGRNIIVDEKVKGKLTILSSREVSIPEAWDIFKAAVNRYGFTVASRGDHVQIIPGSAARSVGAFMSASQANPAGEEYVMAVLIMSQGDPENVVSAVKPLLSENGVLTAYKDGLAVLVVDKASIVNRIGQIVKSLDSLEPSLKTEVIFPKYMEADKVVTAIKPLYKDKESKNLFGIAAFAPSNGVVVSAYPKDLRDIKNILKKLDIPMAAPTKTEPARFFVYHLQFAQADDVAKILSEMLSERQKAVEEQLKESKVPATEEASRGSKPFKGATDDVTGPTGAKDAPPTVAFTSSKVSADTDTNSLVLYVSPSEYGELKTVIAKLDAERSQVQISAIVAEISLKRASELGIGWQALTSGGVIGSYKGGLTEEGLLNVLAGGNFVAGVVGGNTRTITVSNQSVDVPEFFAYLSALNSSNDFNLISAPRVLTQDNKTATINVGQVVPFATGGKLDAYGSPTVTFDYREVGIKLEVTPHMSRTGKIRMEVKQEIQEVTEYLDQEMAGVKFSAPVVSNRSVDTTVTIPDGKTLLIGGLISKRTSDQVKGVPILKDLPLLGWLFRDKSTDDQKTSIFISLTPKIVDLDESIENKDTAITPYLDGIGESGDQNYENRDTLETVPELRDKGLGSSIKVSKPDAPEINNTKEQNNQKASTSDNGSEESLKQLAGSEQQDVPKAKQRTARRYSQTAKRKVFDKMDSERTIYSNVQEPLPKHEQLRTASTEVPAEVTDSLTPASVQITPASHSSDLPVQYKADEVMPERVSIDGQN